jgi:hypothetical protein
MRNHNHHVIRHKRKMLDSKKTKSLNRSNAKKRRSAKNRKRCHFKALSDGDDENESAYTTNRRSRTMVNRALRTTGVANILLAPAIMALMRGDVFVGEEYPCDGVTPGDRRRSCRIVRLCTVESYVSPKKTKNVQELTDPPEATLHSVRAIKLPSTPK